VTASGRGPARILVVDDDPELRRVLALAFADEGYEVRTAPNGREALEALGAWRPGVIVLDLMMPEVDGWAFRARQLATPGAADVPVVVLSAARDVRTAALRPAAVVPKPFNLEQLLAAVADLAR
jgi:CheY-like chemotaxis protein